MHIIGLTGGIASGKSTISCMLKELGAEVIDADILSRSVVKKGEQAYNRIVENFGEQILEQDGEINRKLLGSIVFSNKKKLELLNSITHPEIIKQVVDMLEKLEKKNVQVAVVDAAILIEMNLHSIVDFVWLVVVDRETQVERLMERDHYSSREALNRINSQFTNEEKAKYADVIIDNSQPVEVVREKIEKLWNKMF